MATVTNTDAQTYAKFHYWTSPYNGQNPRTYVQDLFTFVIQTREMKKKINVFYYIKRAFWCMCALLQWLQSCDVLLV